MNTYDFDKTIFYPDSSACFVAYCLRRYPGAVLPTLFKTAWLALRYRLGKVDARTLKEQVFSFLPSLPDVDVAVSDFWQKNEKRIGGWYLAQKRGDDLILSASPRFLLRPICEKLGVGLIATEMDSRSGKISGENCRGPEKVRRFYELYPAARPEAFYSDSFMDRPMAEIADRAFMVKKHRLFPWPYTDLP